MTDPADWKPLSPAFMAALRRYDQASRARVLQAQNRDIVTDPLYHYTSREGLIGIITTQQIWFTHYRYLNDDHEIRFGMNVANALLAKVGCELPKAKIFCDMVVDLFSEKNLDSVFDFYISSFSRHGDNPHLWKNYACDGRGFAIGMAPRLFSIEADRPSQKSDKMHFVSPVRYGEPASDDLYQPAIRSAARIVAETAGRKPQAMIDINRGLPFFREMANRLISTELILHSLTVKGLDWSPENEVRLFILGEKINLKPYVTTRNRGSEIVPFIKGRIPVHRADSISEIVIGPAAPADAEDFACSLIAPFHSDPRSIIRRSTIAYPAP